LPGFQRTSRPAWQPMTASGRTRTRGVTVLGTTLSRRQTVTVGAVLLALIVVLAIVLPLALRSDDEDKAGGSGQKVGAAPTASAVQTTQPAAPATTTTTEPSTAPPTTAPATPKPATSGVAVKLPSGWHLYRDPQWGFAVPVPASWSVSHRGTETYFEETTGQRRLLIVDQTRTPAKDPVKDWQSKEAERQGDYRDYRSLGIRKVDYWDNAADWEYTRTSDRGNSLHVSKRGFITAPDQAYGITWSTPSGNWNANNGLLNLIYQGFKPARS
jgi:hypothetical protein